MKILLIHFSQLLKLRDLVTRSGFTFFVEKKVNNQIKNVFIHDTGNNLKNLSPNVNQTNDTTILAESGIIDNKNFINKWSNNFY